MAEAYSRLYHRFKREFPEIYADDAAFSAWVRLLLLADASWPMHPPLPRSVRSRVLRSLVDVGLVLVDDDNYTVRGMDAERTRRRDAARHGAAMRWQSDGNADADARAMRSGSDGNAIAMPRRDETRLDEKKTREIPPPPAERGRRKSGTNPRATGAAPRATGENPRSNGTSTRQVREEQKRGTTALGDVLREAVRREEAAEDAVPWIRTEPLEVTR